MPALALHALASSVAGDLPAMASVIRARARAGLDARALLREVVGDLSLLRKAWQSYPSGEVPPHYPACRGVLVRTALICRNAARQTT
jgi:hypothetical protein